MKKYKKYAIITLIGGIYYFLLEVLWRGYSHWTMIITGGLCALLVYVINDYFNKVPLFIRCFFGSLIITAAEFVVGIAVNIWLDWNVWDYSDKLFNLMGQICLNSSAIWFLLCIPGFVASSMIRDIFSIKGEEKVGEKKTKC